MKKDKKLIEQAKNLRSKLNKLALGYEDSVSFSLGYITALVDLEKLTRVQAKVLFKCFASYDDEYYFDYDFGIEVKI